MQFMKQVLPCRSGWVGGWVGDRKIEEKQAARMSCCKSVCVCVWGGGGVELLLSCMCGCVCVWVGGWDVRGCRGRGAPGRHGREPRGFGGGTRRRGGNEGAHGDGGACLLCGLVACFVWGRWVGGWVGGWRG